MHGGDVGAGLAQPCFHLLDSDLIRVISHTIDLLKTKPAFFHRDYTGPPIQGGSAHIVSGDDEGDIGSNRGLIRMGAGGHDQSNKYHNTQ